MSRHPRVISLLPAATEIVCALGMEDCLVGRSHACDYPESIRALPACTSTNINPKAQSGEIDARVKAGASQPIYSLDRERIETLRPDLILTQAQCDVCAINEEHVRRVLDDKKGNNPHLVALAAHRMQDLWKDIQTLADALGVTDPGRALVKELKQRCVAIIEQACLVKRRPSVACLEWLDPLMAAGNWVPELVELAGGQNLLTAPGQHSDWLSWEALCASDPSILIIMPCGFNLEKTKQEWTRLRSEASWEKLKAVRDKQVYLTDGNQFFNRPGPRLIDSLEMLAGILHPGTFKALHRGTGWIKA
jgi:iron complex transport system substrate-binding protein